MGQIIRLMAEILHHLGCMKPYKQWDKLPVPQLVSLPDFRTINRSNLKTQKPRINNQSQLFLGASSCRDLCVACLSAKVITSATTSTANSLGSNLDKKNGGKKITKGLKWRLNKQTNKQTNKQASKQTNKQTNKKMCICSFQQQPCNIL